MLLTSVSIVLEDVMMNLQVLAIPESDCKSISQPGWTSLTALGHCNP